ncbi:hypothetical protein SAMN04488118_102417 [Epibacterium ulvae]|uniref:Uncharacterized protein n=1 Tax=Epibacterium ulvae TaxID=1156985 RepID=A0A1G5Q1Z7_9RHOB|nr:hypothetical protein [Epibacterium ulvae]SCZ55431.1 hypothetical protein SAMN04488118_102417 [Epibacterium ulvae]
MLQSLVWIGTAMTLAGMLGLFWCIFKVAQAKRKNLSDDDLRTEVQALIPYNLGTLFLSVFGLILVMLGLFLT